MRNRPWPILLLGGLHIAAPLVGLLVALFLVRPGTFLEFWLVMKPRSTFELLSLYVLIPLAGIAICAVKNWSYPVFLFAMACVGYLNFDLWWKGGGHVSTVFLGIIYVLNVVLVSYFLRPSVRRVYQDRKLRWWEHQPRYCIDLPAALVREGNPTSCTLLNISVGGAKIETCSELPMRTSVTLEFPYADVPLSLSGQPVYQTPATAGSGFQYGIQFSEESVRSKPLRQMIRSLKVLGVDRIPPRRKHLAEFKAWIKQSVTDR